MYEAATVGAAVVIALTTLCSRGYQRLAGSGLASAMRVSVWTSLIGAVAAVITQAGQVQWSWFSVLVALWSAANGTLYTLCSLKALGAVNLTVFTTFSMLGGMLLPFVAGTLIWNEPLTWQKGACCVLLIASIACNIQLENGKEARRGMLLNIAVFILNGFGGIINKVHQAGSDAGFAAVDTGSFAVIVRICTIGLCLLVLLVRRETPLIPLADRKQQGRVWGLMGLQGVLGLISNWILLATLLHMDASLSSALTTGAVIVCTTVMSLLLREHPTRRQLVSVGIAAAGMVCLVL